MLRDHLQQCLNDASLKKGTVVAGSFVTTDKYDLPDVVQPFTEQYIE